MSSALVVSGWGWFLWQGVNDPLGGINSLWPLFGISNQLLAIVALCVGTTVILRMGKARYAYVTLLPLAWLLIVTMTAGYQKLFSPLPKLGFFAHARVLRDAQAAGVLPPGVASPAILTQMIGNDYLNAAVAGFFLLSVLVILVSSSHQWFLLLSGRRRPTSTEVPFTASRVAAGTSAA
jgi:carbon starvation protein